MQEWFEALSAMEKVFLYIAVPSTVILVIQTLLLLFGLGGDGSGDGTGELDEGGEADDGGGETVSDSGLRIFTVRGFIAFFTMLGWGGLAFLRAGMHAAFAVTVAVVLGVLSMLLIAVIFKLSLKLQSDGTLRMENAVGKSGTVYITVPPKREQKGKVTLLVQERLVELDAVTDSPKPLKTGAEVTVVALSGKSTVVVSPK